MSHCVKTGDAQYIRPSVRRLLRRAVTLLPVLVGLTGAWLGMLAFASDTVAMGPFRAQLDAGFGPGRTAIALPPLGELRVDTHRTPLAIRVTLLDLNVNQLSEDLKEKSTSEIVRDVEADARHHALPFALRVLGAATGVALVAALAVFRLRWRPGVVAAVAAVIAVGGSQAGAWRTFDQESFAEPTFVGTLRLAPQLLGSAGEITKRLDEFRVNLERIVGGAIKAYSALQPAPVDGDDLRVLHISDVHLNTLGLDFAVELARGFDVDLIVDTGDLTSYGTPIEETIASQIPRFDRPYVFVRGNHDSVPLQETIAALPNAQVLDGSHTTVEGLTIYGLAHPVFTEDAQAEVDHSEFVARALEAGTRIDEDLRRLDLRPDVVAVHDDRMTQTLAGRVPLVISGHYHRPRTTVDDGTIFMRAGTTGGAGVNLVADQVPLSATILYFQRGAPPRLVAYDVIEQSPTTGRLNLQRHLAPEAEPIVPATESPTATEPPG
jgi:predicted phosphodiesterase